MASFARNIRPLSWKAFSASAACRLATKRPCLEATTTGVAGQLSRRFSAVGAAWEKRYTREHEWVELSEDGTIGTIGISAYASKSLGDIVFVELPQLNNLIAAGDVLGAVESVKSASDILSPVSGAIIETNSVLEEKPGLLNESPEGDGWIVRIGLEEGARAVDELMDGEEYRKFTETEE
ncbi:MAG: glycine cleavage system H-protein subunit [Trichoglossum hirsutum]|nr:MAG: glycine cleavage system H-protein subunit [Trichoglossum hirsutum]